MDYRVLYETIAADPRYQANLDWGKARPGHPEGTVRAHIAELEQNLEVSKSRLGESDYWKLKVLIHTHDTFKRDAHRGVPISHSRSHSSLARFFLAEICSDPDLRATVQLHDEPYALWRQAQERGAFSHERLSTLIETIQDWNLFLAFCLIDSCTAGKDRAPLRWLFEQVTGKVKSSFTAADILPVDENDIGDKSCKGG